jgi:hypothetical protein
MIPARTGTEGRGGRLRAVHATASASTSRATRNSISPPHARLCCSLPLVCLLSSLLRPSCPRGSSCRAGCPRGQPGRAVPIVCVVREHPGINSSSSSSQVWKLGTGPVRAGRPPTGPVGPLWAGDRRPVSTRGQLDRCAPTATVLHPRSPVDAQVRPHPTRIEARGPGTAVGTRVRSVWTGPPARVDAAGQRRAGARRASSRRWTSWARRPIAGISPTCAQSWGQGDSGTTVTGPSYCRARLLMRAVSSVTWV